MPMTVKHGDTHMVRWQVLDKVTKEPRDLLGATAEVHIRLAKQKDTPTIVLPASIENPDEGIVVHQLDGTVPVGTYDLQISVIQNGEQTTSPTTGSDSLTVLEDLA